MGFNGAGSFAINADGYPFEYDTVTSEVVMNSVLSEIAAGLSNTICKDGQTVISQNLPFNGKRITNLGTPDDPRDAADSISVITNRFAFATSISGTNDLILGTVGSSGITLVEGLQIWFRPSAANTTAVTANVNSLGVKNVTKAGTIPLSPGDLQAGALTCIVYDGFQWQMVTPYYAEGSWTPSVGGDATYTTQTGRWTKIGRAVHIMGVLTINVIGTGSTSVVSGLPFTSLNLVNQAVAVSDFASLATNVAWIGARVNTNATTVTLRNLTAAGASATSSTLLGNGSSVTLAGTYII